MADMTLRIWYDKEGDCLEVTFDQKPGFFRETAVDEVMKKVDVEGRLLGFSVLNASARRPKPLEVTLST